MIANVLPLVEFIVTVAFAKFLIAPYSLIVTVPLIIGSPAEPAFLVVAFEVNCNVELFVVLL